MNDFFSHRKCIAYISSFQNNTKINTQSLNSWNSPLKSENFPVFLIKKIKCSYGRKQSLAQHSPRSLTERLNIILFHLKKWKKEKY